MSQTTPSNVTAMMPSKEQSKPLKEIAKLGEVFQNAEFMQRVAEAVPKHMTPSRMIRTMVGAIRNSPNLLQCEVLDVASKMLICAQAGLEINTPLGHAYLVPFKNMVWDPKTRQRSQKWVCQVIFGYHGLLDLSFRTGVVGAISAREVWADEARNPNNWSFSYGTDGHLRHIPMGKPHERSAEAQANGTAETPTWVWALATLKDGLGAPFEVMPWGEIEAIRNKSPAYKSALFSLEEARKAGRNLPRGYTDAPWVAHVGPMAKKTAFRQLSNWIPRTIELANAMALDSAQEQAPVDFGPIIDSSDYMAAGVDAAEASGDPGATFGTRGELEHEAAPETAETKPAAATTTATRAPAQRKQAAPRQTTSPPPPPPPPPPAPTTEPFDYYLVDVAGEFLGADSYSSPTTWAQAFIAEWQRTAPEYRDGLREQNADAIEDARKTSREATNTLAEMERDDEPPVETEAAPVEIPVVEVTITRGKADWPTYLKDLKASLATQTAENFLDWCAAQEPRVAGAPTSARVAAAKIIAVRAEALGIAPPLGYANTGEAQQSEAAPEAQVVDKDLRQADALCERLQTAPDLHRLQAIVSEQISVTLMGRWDNDRPELSQRVRDAYNGRQAELRAGA